MSKQSKDDYLNKLRKLAKEVIHNQENNVESPLPEEFAERFPELLHELEIHQIELDLQQEELSKTNLLLQKSERRFYRLFNLAPTGYLVMDFYGIILRANEIAGELLGILDPELENQRLIKFVAQPHKDDYYLFWRRLSRTESEQQVTVNLVRSDDTLRTVQIVGHRDQEDAVCRVALTDITEIERARESLQQALDKERELSNLKSQLITVISHEMRTPLAIILSSVEILDHYSDKIDAQKRKEKFDVIRQSIEFLNDVINDVIDSNELENQVHQTKLELFDAIHFTTRIISDINQISPGGQRANMVVETPDVSQEITSDKHLLQQVLNNLIQNGLKYSEEDVRCHLHLTQNHFTIEIEDRGQGIPLQDQKHITEMFYRGKNTISVSGTGIGLYIVDLAVQALQGEISFESSQAGTTFRVTFPRYPDLDD